MNRALLIIIVGFLMMPLAQAGFSMHWSSYGPGIAAVGGGSVFTANNDGFGSGFYYDHDSFGGYVSEASTGGFYAQVAGQRSPYVTRETYNGYPVRTVRYGDWQPTRIAFGSQSDGYGADLSYNPGTDSWGGAGFIGSGYGSTGRAPGRSYSSAGIMRYPTHWYSGSRTYPQRSVSTQSAYTHPYYGW